MTEAQPSLRWTTQLRIADTSTSKLQGDKILLPPSALEQLLSAATVVVTGQEENSPWGSGGGPMRILDRKQDLPHPLTFRLVSPSSGNVVYAGIRQFTAEDGEIGISNFLRRVLDLKDEQAPDEEKLTVHVEELLKGTYVKLRPLEAGYDADWKPLLERYMRTNFTTLTKGIILDVPSGDGNEYRFLVDELKPKGSVAVCIVDTDLEVDIEALNEEQARETVKRKAEKEKSGGLLYFGQTIQGQVVEGGYVDYTLTAWDRTKDISIKLSSEGEVCLYLSPLSSRQRNRPREGEHVIAAVEGSPLTIELRKTNVELEIAEQLCISVHGHEAASFSLTLGSLQAEEPSSNSTTSTSIPSEDETICKNCQQSIPKRTLMLHESFCYRHNVLCPKCNQVFQKSSSVWSSHWHCPFDSSHGNTELSQTKHNHLFHEQRTCPGCSESFPSTLSLAQHRTTICPAKPILCQFCHLEVPQQGPDDQDFTSAEVLLSGLTPHELSDGARTTECHLCGKFIRLRDMDIHMRHHDLARKSKPTPLICANKYCGRTLPSSSNPSSDDPQLGLCATCFAPLYASGYDPSRKALKRRTERRYLTQFLTGCGHSWCRNEICKTGRTHLDLPAVSSKDGLALVRSELDSRLLGDNTEPTDLQREWKWRWRFCADDERVQKCRVDAEERVGVQNAIGTKDGYDLAWWVAAFEACKGDGGRVEVWLGERGRRINE